MTELQVGDLGTWKSQANASRLKKVGVIVGVIRPCQRVHMKDLDFSVVPGNRSRHHRSFELTSEPMGYVSYVVSVKTGVTDKAKRTLYHPRAVTLAGPDDQDGVWAWNPQEGKWNAR